MNIKHTTIKPLLLALALLPGVALADDHCKFSQPQAMDLDLAGVKAVVFEVNSHDLRLQASPAARAALSGRACASSQDLLGQLSLTQEKVGDKLVVRLQRESRGMNISFGSSYAWLDIAGTLPDTMMVQLKVGSGDASLSGAQAMSADVGSGDVKARDIKALATAAVGSGDIELDNVGALHVVSIGSGDVRVGGVRGDASIGSIGSGDLELRDVQGNVDIASIGSGDADVGAVRGTVTLGTLGSGDLRVRDAGSLRVRHTGSGSVDHSGIRGAVELPKKR
ncbi:DUF4097 family beta strand repeat-containing protein [Stenotrophomonas acidaminiphila]|jgi:DUF4097 and DUF4098 domain-containing protein YvlB|uniref:Putative auto-transporter adhesin, head GIN domain n=1 Tax=Stenotrophomonas acidaminiphila TaxID=128780 RepID=A0A0S1B0V1_9GAMM|nr:MULTISPECIES: DUF4097 family beta strand repeat-containing protein [Stenotrophomonas]ALJ28686.1 Putative auto-transporter adhesin, head GIN domain [Stenotrophomonas acidaminiphila]QOF97266.1 DUF4097 family beta strand repeat protein [Stenotrophomonas sp. CW117]